MVVPTVQSLLEQGETTCGMSVTPIGRGRYGLSLYDRNRWDPLPYEGTLDELVDVLNTDLGAWAAAGPDVPA